ncbi:peptidoglycan DD-metalloendopeptidase family protein [Hyphobacterium sp. CCMP332]|nr:peptidoglycan DD-metalloendopeptidase family protein [Hyphobacterium sp. CCMP332]
MSGTKLFTLLFLLLFVFNAFAQSRSSLEKQKSANQRRIAEASKILKQTQNKKKATLGQFRALINQINQRQALINTIQQELDYLNEEIAENEKIINALEEDLRSLKKEYAAMLYNAQKNRGALQKIMFLFSSGDFNEFRRRLQYLEQYAEARKAQAREIEKVKEYLDEQNRILIQTKNQKEELLNLEKEESEKLEKSRREQQKLLADLGKKEKQLRSELKKRKEDAKRLETLIKKLVEKEVKKSASKSGRMALTPEAAQLAATFEKNRRQLPWPVRTGFISEKFGENNHPVLRGVKIKNDGIDIQSGKGESVRAVFEGTVLTVAIIPGNNTAVMIKHGNYITVYAGIKNVKVKKGDKISTKDVIGEVATDQDGTSKMQFQIWRDFEKLNPEEWLFRK